MTKFVAEIYGDHFDVFSLYAKVKLVPEFISVRSFATIQFTSCLQRIMRIKSLNSNQIFKLLKLILVAFAANAISETLLSFSMLKKLSTKKSSTVDNNHLHYMMVLRIKQEDIIKTDITKPARFPVGKLVNS